MAPCLVVAQRGSPTNKAAGIREHDEGLLTHLHAAQVKVAVQVPAARVGILLLAVPPKRMPHA